MKALNDKAELKERNKAYKVTLEYCEETCNDVDELFSAFNLSLYAANFPYEQQKYVEDLIEQLRNDVKDVGTRKLRKAFTDYVLKNTKE